MTLPPPWLIKLAGGLALLAAVGGAGWRYGAQGVQRKWDAQVIEDRAAAETARESDRLRARAAETSYVARSAAAARRAANPSPESVYALHATICPPAGPLGRALELGDVPVSRAVLDRLRDAGADY